MNLTNISSQFVTMVIMVMTNMRPIKISKFDNKRNITSVIIKYVTVFKGRKVN